MSRAIRRHHRARKIAKAEKVLALSWLKKDPERNRLLATKIADHLTACSCVLCGNPRRHFGAITRREKVSLTDLKEQREELETKRGLVSMQGRFLIRLMCDSPSHDLWKGMCLLWVLPTTSAYLMVWDDSEKTWFQRDRVSYSLGETTFTEGVDFEILRRVVWDDGI